MSNDNRKCYHLPQDALSIIMSNPDRRSALILAPDAIVCSWYRVMNGYVFSTRENAWLVSSPGQDARMMELRYD